jgi:hypothetical protein
MCDTRMAETRTHGELLREARAMVAGQCRRRPTRSHLAAVLSVAEAALARGDELQVALLQLAADPGQTRPAS